jgi:hypothetical protein
MKMEATCSSKTLVDFHRLYGIISPKMEFFKVQDFPFTTSKMALESQLPS